jgi:hypothetical protein
VEVTWPSEKSGASRIWPSTPVSCCVRLTVALIDLRDLPWTVQRVRRTIKYHSQQIGIGIPGFGFSARRPALFNTLFPRHRNGRGTFRAPCPTRLLGRPGGRASGPIFCCCNDMPRERGRLEGTLRVLQSETK